jgi:hypothetical protein
MARNVSLPSTDPNVNGQQTGPGDANEPPAVPDADLRFDPAELEGDTPAGPSTPAGPDPFDLASLRLTQDLEVGVGVKKALLKIPVRKPSKGAFCRVHPSEEYRIATAVIDPDDGSRELYLVAGELRPALVTEPTLKPMLLATAVDRQGVLFLWPAALPKGDRDFDAWSSMREAINPATQGWVRVAWSDGLGAYDVAYATGDLGEPEWPDLPFQDLLRIAFKDRFITTLDHPKLRQLRGEV